MPDSTNNTPKAKATKQTLTRLIHISQHVHYYDGHDTPSPSVFFEQSLGYHDAKYNVMLNDVKYLFMWVNKR